MLRALNDRVLVRVSPGQAQVGAAGIIVVANHPFETGAARPPQGEGAGSIDVQRAACTTRPLMLRSGRKAASRSMAKATDPTALRDARCAGSSGRGLRMRP